MEMCEKTKTDKLEALLDRWIQPYHSVEGEHLRHDNPYFKGQYDVLIQVRKEYRAIKKQEINEYV
jgi:hypothetical protein